jgi:hypothetical protein
LRYLNGHDLSFERNFIAYNIKIPMYKVIRSSKNHVAGNYLNEVEHKQRWPGVATEPATIKAR